MKKNILEYLEKSAQKYPDKTEFADEIPPVLLRNWNAQAER